MNSLAAVPRETLECVGANHVPGCEHFPAPSTPMVLEEIACDVVDVGTNVRIDPGELADMAASIAELGVLQPVKVVGPHADGRYRLVWGQRRLLASVMAGKATIPAWVVPTADVDAPGPRRSIEQLAENLQRADLNPIDEAKAIREVLADGKITQAELARRLGRNPSWVANTLGLLRAPEGVQELIRSGDITAAHAKAIGGLPPARQGELAKKAVDQELSAHDLESAAKWDRERIAETAKRAKTSQLAAEHAVQALEAAKLPPLAPVWIDGRWDVDSNLILKAVKTAGYTIGDGYVGWGEPPKGCDCIGFRVTINDRKEASVRKVCINVKHWEAEEARRRARAKDKQTAEERDLAASVRSSAARAWIGARQSPGQPTSEHRKPPEGERVSGFLPRQRGVSRSTIRGMEPQESRRHWPRVTLTLSPEAADALAELAQRNYRNRKQEALRLLLDGLARELPTPKPAGTR